MNIEPITKEVEQTFHLSIPKARIDVVEKIITDNSEITSDVARDLVISAAVGIRVPNPKSNNPDNALAQIAPHLDELWYNLNRLTSKTVHFEPADVILNQDRRTLSLHIRWSHQDTISESTLFINFKKFETFPEFYKDIYSKLNKSLHTNMLPYRLVFLSYGKMSRLACLPLSAARELAEKNKVVFDDLYLDARDSADTPETNCSLVPTLKELIEDLPYITKPGDYKIDIAQDNVLQITSEIQDIIDIHPEKPAIKAKVLAESYARQKPDALPNSGQLSEQHTIDVALEMGDIRYFRLGDNFLLLIANYLNTALSKTDSTYKFYTVQSDYNLESFGIVCCTEDDIKPFKEYGYICDKAEPWMRNQKTIDS